MWKKLKAVQISAFGLSGLQAGVVQQISDAKVLIACRQAEAAAVIKRAENLEAIAESLRYEAADKSAEASRAEKWVARLEKTIA